jgi:hypothetical protein
VLCLSDLRTPCAPNGSSRVSRRSLRLRRSRRERRLAPQPRRIVFFRRPRVRGSPPPPPSCPSRVLPLLLLPRRLRRLQGRRAAPRAAILQTYIPPRLVLVPCYPAYGYAADSGVCAGLPGCHNGPDRHGTSTGQPTGDALAWDSGTGLLRDRPQDRHVTSTGQPDWMRIPSRLRHGRLASESELRPHGAGCCLIPTTRYMTGAGTSRPSTSFSSDVIGAG